MAFYQISKRISIAPLVVFRLLFGALAFAGTLRFLLKGWVSELYIQPEFYFGFYGFEWVKPLAGNWMYLPFILMLIGSLGIILGWFYKLSATTFFIAFTYIELLDKTNYLNHYYFFSLVAFLLIWLPANARFSLDTKFGRTINRSEIPKFYTQLLQFQLACVYVFAGIAKINYDWLFTAEPLFTWLQSHRDMPFFGFIFSQKWTAFAFSWFGCLYDIFIVFFLLNNRTRPLAYFFVIAFHLMTGWLFPIGVFPYVMICLTLIFFSVTFHENILNKMENWLKIKPKKNESTARIRSIRNIYFASIVFFFIQTVVPMRHLAYPGELFWNEEGFRFSWRVMLMHKEGLATFYIRDPKTKGEIEIQNQRYLTKRQEEQMSTQPDMILQFAHFLESEFQDTILKIGSKNYRIQNPSVHANVYIALNGRSSQKMIDHKIDLTKKQYNLQHRDWLETFKR
jgi:hypothetical protein